MSENETKDPFKFYQRSGAPPKGVSARNKMRVALTGNSMLSHNFSFCKLKKRKLKRLQHALTTKKPSRILTVCIRDYFLPLYMPSLGVSTS